MSPNPFDIATVGRHSGINIYALQLLCTPKCVQTGSD